MNDDGEIKSDSKANRSEVAKAEMEVNKQCEPQLHQGDFSVGAIVEMVGRILFVCLRITRGKRRK